MSRRARSTVRLRWLRHTLTALVCGGSRRGGWVSPPAPLREFMQMSSGGEQMASNERTSAARVGDVIETRGTHGRPARRGEIVELLGGDGHEHYPGALGRATRIDRVSGRWSGDHPRSRAPPQHRRVITRRQTTTRHAPLGFRSPPRRDRRTIDRRADPSRCVILRAPAGAAGRVAALPSALRSTATGSVEVT